MPKTPYRKFKKFYKRYRRFRKHSIRKNISSSNNMVYKFTRIANQTNISQTGGIASAGAMIFRLSDVPNYTEFTNLYDQYRIKGVKVIFDFTSQEPNINASYNFIGKFYTAIDLDDNNTPSEVEIQQMRYCKVRRPIGTVTRYLKPRALNTMYNDGVTSAYSLSPKKLWIDVAYPSVYHYSLKYFWTSMNASFNGLAYVTVKYYLEFRNPR